MFTGAANYRMAAKQRSQRGSGTKDNFTLPLKCEIKPPRCFCGHAAFSVDVTLSYYKCKVRLIFIQHDVHFCM